MGIKFQCKCSITLKYKSASPSLVVLILTCFTIHHPRNLRSIRFNPTDQNSSNSLVNRSTINSDPSINIHCHSIVTTLPKVAVCSIWLKYAMSLLDQLWDDTLAGPRPESGLGKLRKHPTFSFRPASGKGTNFIVFCRR